MKLLTRDFGEVDISEDLIITFAEGIPGFHDLTKFFFILDKDMGDDERSAFIFLQSAEKSEVAFILVDMKVFDDEYSPIIDATEIEDLGEFNSDDFLVLNFVVIPGDDIQNMTVNLKAPLIINDKLKIGKQVICNNEEYSIRHNIFK